MMKMDTNNCIHAAVFALASALALVQPVSAEPKEQTYGKDQTSPFHPGWPIRSNPPNRLAAYDGRGLQALFGKKDVWMQPSGTPKPLPRAEVKFGFLNDPADLLKKHAIMGIMLGKEGIIVFEKYQFGTSSASLFDGQSIPKVFTALSLGIAIEQGQAIDLNAKMSSMVQQLKGSPIGEATVRQTLNMQCGHEFKWVDNGTEGSAGKYAQVRFAAADKGGRDLYSYFKELQGNIPGRTFAYDPHCSDAISMLVTARTGIPLRRFFEESVWKKLGTSSKAAWLSPSQNPELTTGASGFYATLPDYALLANAMVNKGLVDGKAVLPADWLDKMQGDTVSVSSDENANFPKYGYQMWVRDDKEGNWHAGLGNNGQRFYLDPINKSFMVIFALDFDHIKDSDKFWRWFRKTPMEKL